MSLRHRVSPSRAWLTLGFGFLVLASGCSKKESEEKLTAPAAVASASAEAAPTAAPAVAPSPEACQKCEQNSPCAEFSEGCSALQGEDRAACEAVDQCLDTSNCADGTKSFTSCFCGSMTTDNCLVAPVSGKGAPDGACADVMRKAFGTGKLTNHELLVRFLKPEYPIGVAITRRNCQKGNDCGPVCGF